MISRYFELKSAFSTLLIFALSIPLSSLARPENFTEAKKALVEIYGRTGKEFYCGCDFNRTKVNPESCGFKSDKYLKRQSKNEAEHVVPAENWGRSFSEWREGAPDCQNRKSSFKGRKCASKVSEEFRHMEGDLHNLVPSIGTVNALRSNSDPEMIQSGYEHFGACKTRVTKNAVEPRDEIKGYYARKYMYMAYKYPKRFKMGSRTEKLMSAWDKMFPVTKEECEYDMRIAKIQGWNNPFVREKCK